MAAMANVHHCPSCELIFRNKTELEYHWAEEHDPRLRPGATVEEERPSRGGGLPRSEVDAALASLPGWAVEGGAVVKQFSLPSFSAAIEFVDTVAGLAEEANHHPDLDIRYTKVRVGLVTHSAGGITEKDLDMAGRIETQVTS